MKKTKKLISLLLAVVMILSVSAVGASAATTYTSGDYEYTVSGNEATITKYKGSASTVNVPSLLDGKTVTKIGYGSFHGNTSITKLTIPSTVIAVGSTSNDKGAFSDCTKLQTVTINGSSKDAYLGWNSFDSCPSLQEITIPGNYTKIYPEAFYECISLKKMVFKKSSYIQPNQEILHDAFNGCKSLESISLPDTLKSIGPNAFRYCTSLSSLVIPEGVTSISYGAFNNCTRLITLSLPSTIETIGSTSNDTGAFSECSRLQEVTIAKGSNDAYLGWNTFDSCTSLQEITIPGNYISIYPEAFKECSSLKKLTLNKSEYVYTNQTILHDAFNGCKSLESISLPTTLKSIGSCAFRYCSSLSSLVIPEGVTTISYGAFNHCTKLSSLTLPSTIETIGSTSNDTGVFSDCTNLRTVTIKEGTKDAYLGWNSFDSCTSLQEITVPGNYTAIYPEAFNECTSLKKMTYKKSSYVYANQDIMHNAFYNCNSLKTVSLPETLNHIGSAAFRYCTTLANLVIPEGVTSIDYGAFNHCTGLVTLSLPSTIEKIGSTSNDTGVFSDCGCLQTVTIYEGKNSAYLGWNTFDSCSSLKEIVIPDNYTKIYSEAFNACSSLYSAHVPAAVTSIGDNAFSKCAPNLTICSTTSNCYAKTYAAEKGINFKVCSGHKIDVPKTTISAPSITLTNVASSGKIKISWNAVSGAKEYKVYLATSSGGTYKLMKTTFSTSYTNTSATAGKTYYYKVRAVASDGTLSKYSSVKSRTCDLAKPVVTSSNVSSSGKIKLKWDKVEGATSYKVYRATSKSGTYKLMKTTSSTSYTNTSATAGKTYYYKVKAVCSNSAADSAYSSIITRTCDLAKPTNVQFYFNSSNKPVVKWSKVDGATSYKVYRATSQNGTYKLMKTTTSTSYTNTSISHGTTYYYKVKAICSNSAADSAYSAVVGGYVK